MLNNEELKKKICKIIADNYLPKEMPDRLEDYKLYRFARAADALIKAGIGDVKDLKVQVDSLEITNIALQAGYDDAEKDRLYWVDKYKEAEHRAETLERAFRDFLAEYLTAVNEANSYDCGIPEMFGRYANVLPYEDKVTNLLNEYLQQAEKELAEEEKEC